MPRLVALLSAIVCLAAAPAPAAPQRDQCVVLISVDGLANFYLDDPKADMPTVRRMARAGARAEEGMVCSFPTVTWPNHVSMATGVTPARHGVVGNSYLDRQTGKSVTLLCDPVFDADQTVLVPAIYDMAHAARLKTAAICWPATRNPRSLDWHVPDMGGDAWDRYGSKTWMNELRAAGLPVDMQGKWVTEPAGGVQRDWLYARMAAHVLKHHAPNLLLIHFVEPDHVQHRTGTRSPESYWCASYADDRIRDVVEAVNRSKYKDKATIFVCGDHGFFTIEQDIKPNVVLKRLGLATVKDGKPAAQCQSQGGGCGVYIFDAARREEIKKQLTAELAKIEGVDAVLDPADPKLGQPTPDKQPRAPDLWLSAKNGYSFSESAAGDETVSQRKSIGGTHGFLPDQPDMRSACVVWGTGVKQPGNMGKVSILDVAPSIATVLGISLPGAEGKPLPAVTEK